MKTRNSVRITSFMTVALVILVVISIVNTKNMNSYKQQLETGYAYSLGELSENLNTVNANLTKSLYSNSGQEQEKLSRELYAECSSAKSSVSRLPVSQMELGNIYKFLSQAGDYALYIEQKLSSGQQITDREHQNIKTLLDYSQKFSKSVSDMTNMVSSGAKITDGKVKSAAQNVNVTPLSNNFSQSAESFKSFPTLLYDGPFSDKVLNKKSVLVSNSQIKSKEECRAIAARAINTNVNKLSYESDDGSSLSSYSFKCGRYTVSVTKRGGYVKNILYSGVAGDSRISERDAVLFAKKYLDFLGYSDMKESYFSKSDNICTVNFAYSKGGVCFYGDLIKVGVSLSDGKPVSLDAETYLANHVDREAFKAKITPDEAKSRISPYLKINGVQQCVIPKENGKEVQCYEFSCTGKETGEDTLVYINNKTGSEEDIMLLLHTDSGTFTQ